MERRGVVAWSLCFVQIIQLSWPIELLIIACTQITNRDSLIYLNESNYLYRMVHVIDDPDDAAAGWLAAARRRSIGLRDRLLASTSSRPSAGTSRGATVPHAVLFAVARRLLKTILVNNKL